MDPQDVHLVVLGLLSVAVVLLLRPLHEAKVDTELGHDLRVLGPRPVRNALACWVATATLAITIVTVHSTSVAAYTTSGTEFVCHRPSPSKTNVSRN